MQVGYDGRSWERIQALEDLESTGDEVIFQDFTTGEQITVHRDEANELLGEIGADLLQQEFEGTVTITYTFTVKAESVEDAEEKVKNAVGGLEYSIDADADDEYSEESIEVESDCSIHSFDVLLNL